MSNRYMNGDVKAVFHIRLRRGKFKEANFCAVCYLCFEPVNCYGDKDWRNEVDIS